MNCCKVILAIVAATVESTLPCTCEATPNPVLSRFLVGRICFFKLPVVKSQKKSQAAVEPVEVGAVNVLVAVENVLVVGDGITRKVDEVEL